jgi:superfamily I DNA and/or RNA helicase
MSSEISINQQLISFKNALLNIPSTDILVHCDVSNSKLKYVSLQIVDEAISLDSQWKKILKQNEALANPQTETTLCLASGLYLKDKHTPIFITPLDFQWINKNQTFQIEPLWENTFVNPWLEKELDTYQQKIEFDNEKTIQENLEEIQNNLFFQKQGVQIEEHYFIGNFHHHRFLILREIETLLEQPKSKLIQHLFGEKIEKTEHIQLSKGQISSQDSDQLKAIHTFEKENLVVEGPPGTGKSTLITNLIAKSIASHYNVLLFSEKKVALEIIYQKAKQHRFENLCYFNPENKTETFIRTLEKSWKQLENEDNLEPKNLFLSEQYRNQLQSLLDKINSPTLIENTSFQELQSWFKKTPPTEAIFLQEFIPIENWKQVENTVIKLYEGEHKKPPFYGYKKGNIEAYVESEKTNEKYSLIVEYLEKFKIKNKKLLNTFKRKISFSQIILNEKEKLYFELYLNIKNKEQFLKNTQKYKSQNNKISQLKNRNNSWTKIPTLTQLDYWKDILTNGNFYHKWKLKNTLKNFLNDNTTPPLKLIDELIEIEQEKLKLEKIEQTFQKLGIHHPDIEIPQIELTLSLLTNYSELVEEMTKEEMEIFTEEKFQFLELIQWLERTIDINENIDLITHIQDIQADFNFNVKNSYISKNISKDIIRFVQQFNTINECKQAISNHYLYLIQHYFPQLIDFDNSKIVALVNNIVSEEKIEQHLFEKELIRTQQKKFHEYNQLILQSDTKLTTEQKEFKKQLKNGKRILVKAFAKTRYRQSIQDFTKSDAIHWIKILMPIWLVTPSQLASLFSLEENLFDICIADEASQIPLMNGLGALQRSKRAIILGDSKQMSPTNYFSGIYQSVDLLHQASYYFEKSMLKHHYRSKHSQLIAFSNKHFYNNDLQPFPSVSISSPLHLHYLENGVFENRTNTTDAIKINELITSSINSTKKIGIVAFSNEQKELIYKLMNTETKQLLEGKINRNEAFIKSLEQVQGDECDILYISMGYAKNHHGHFQLQMGPLNRKNGYRRLNVLFTRAKEELHFITSVKSDDFPWSDNESIQLLKNYIYQLENKKETNELTFPFNLTPKIEGNSLLVSDLSSKITTEREMVTCIDTLQKRGWEIR